MTICFSISNETKKGGYLYIQSQGTTDIIGLKSPSPLPKWNLAITSSLGLAKFVCPRYNCVITGVVNVVNMAFGIKNGERCLLYPGAHHNRVKDFVLLNNNLSGLFTSVILSIRQTSRMSVLRCSMTGKSPDLTSAKELSVRLTDSRDPLTVWRTSNGIVFK